MNYEQLIAREIIKALNDNAHIIFKPALTKVRRVPMGTLSKLYPLHVEVDDGRRFIGGDCPSSSVVNSAHVYETVRLFGRRSYRS